MTDRIIRIGFATADWAVRAEHVDGAPTLGGSGHYRIGQPAKYLASRPGWDVQVGTLVSDIKHGRGFGVRTWDGENQWDLDIIVLQRWMFESIAIETQLARSIGQVVVNDVDDWFDGLKPSNQAYWTTHPKYNKQENRDNYRLVLYASTAITCSTPFLAAQYAGHPNVAVLENVIDTDMWPVRDPRPGTPNVGWAGALPWRSGDLEVLQGVIQPFLRKYDLRFHHAGHIESSQVAKLADLAKIDPARVDTSGMVVTPDIPLLYEEIDIGVVPLSNVPFNHAKSWIKGLEYAASGIPFVASASPEYVRLAATYGMGEVAHKRGDWYRLMRQYLDAEARVEEGRRLQGLVADHFSLAARGAEWEQFYRSLL